VSLSGQLLLWIMFRPMLAVLIVELTNAELVRASLLSSLAEDSKRKFSSGEEKEEEEEKEVSVWSRRVIFSNGQCCWRGACKGRNAASLYKTLRFRYATAMILLSNSKHYYMTTM